MLASLMLPPGRFPVFPPSGVERVKESKRCHQIAMWKSRNRTMQENMKVKEGVFEKITETMRK